MPHPILSGYLPVENGRLFYEIAGGGAPLVFMHGFSLDHRMWDSQWDYFRARYTTIRYDWRGHGRSSDPAGPWSNGDDLMLLLAHLGVGPAHLCGLSAGGGIALDFAVTYPEAARSLVLIDSTVGGFRGWSQAFRNELVEMRRIAREEGLDAALARWQEDAMLAPAFEKPDVADRLRRIVGDYRGWSWLNDGEEIVPDPLPYDRLEEVRAPALVVVGEHDTEDFRKIAEVLSERIRGARLEVVGGAGHMSSMEAPTLVNGLIAEFLAAQELAG
jgi:pimeloyl-ACP methyl ester carboxylesterase